MNQLIDSFESFETQLKTYILTHNCQYVYISLGSKYNETKVDFHYPKKYTYTNSMYQMIPTFVRNMSYEKNVLVIVIDDFHDDILLSHNNKHLLNIIDEFKNIDIIMLDFLITLQNLPLLLGKIMNCISSTISPEKCMICNFICFKRPNHQDIQLEDKLPPLIYNTLKSIHGGIYKKCYYQWCGYKYYTYHHVYNYETYHMVYMFHIKSLFYLFEHIIKDPLDDYNKESLDIFMEKKTQHSEKWIQFKKHTLCLL